MPYGAPRDRRRWRHFPQTVEDVVGQRDAVSVRIRDLDEIVVAVGGLIADHREVAALFESYRITPGPPSAIHDGDLANQRVHARRRVAIPEQHPILVIFES